MRRLAWTLLALATALVPPHHKRHTRRTVQQKANIFEQAADAASKFFEERARQDSLALAKFTEGLEKSRQNFLSDLRGIFDVKGASLDQTLEKLEDALLSADIGATTTDQILDDVKAVAQAQGDYTEQDVTAILRGRMAEALMKGGPSSLTSSETGPTVILVLGANGMGKTTTIGKLARRLRAETGQKVLLAACDTFRAAAVADWPAGAKKAGELRASGPLSFLRVLDAGHMVPMDQPAAALRDSLWSGAVAALIGSCGPRCDVVDRDALLKAVRLKLVWSSALWLICARHGGDADEARRSE